MQQESYLHHLNSLLLHHPLKPRVAHSLAVQCFGDDAVQRILGMDDYHGGEGMNLMQLKRQIRCLTHEEDQRRRSHPPHRDLTQRHPRSPVFSKPTNQQFTPSYPMCALSAPERPPQHLSEPLIHWCCVCGSTEHAWPLCPQKKPKGCAKCGSTGHFVRNCAQRLLPPWQPVTASTKPTNAFSPKNAVISCATFPNNIPTPPATSTVPLPSPPEEQPVFIRCLSTPPATHLCSVDFVEDLPVGKTEQKEKGAKDVPSDVIILNVPDTVGAMPTEAVETSG